jgi:hypothetical protein
MNSLEAKYEIRSTFYGIISALAKKKVIATASLLLVVVFLSL